MAKKAAKRESTILGRAELAKKIGVSSRQISYYAERGMPQLAKGQFCLEDCLAWVEASVKPSGRDEPEADENSRGYWETEKAKWEAKLKQLAYETERGELIEIDLVARDRERSIIHAKTLFEQIPDRLLGLLPRSLAAKAKKDILARAAEMIEDVLFALSDSELITIEEERAKDPDDHDRELPAPKSRKPKKAEAAKGGGLAADRTPAGPRVGGRKRKAAKRNQQ